MDIIDIKNEIKNSNNIFDVYINIYHAIDKCEIKIIRAVVDRNEEKYVSYSLNIYARFISDDFNITISETNKSILIKFIEASTTESDFYLRTYVLFKEIDKVFGDKDILNSKCNKNIGMGGLSLTGKKTEKIKPLNSNKTYNKGYVYHFNHDNVLNYNEHKYRTQSKVNASIEGTIKNIFVYKSEDRKDYNIVLSSLTSQHFNKKLKKYENNLKIAIVPFINGQDYLILDKEKEKQGFYVNGVNFENEYKEKLLTIIKELNEKEVNIVVFPEMVMTKLMIDELKKFLKENKNSFLIIAAGTVWENGVNYCKLIIGDGNEIIKQEKCNPFHSQNGWEKLGTIELLNLDKRIINIIDIPNFGRCGVAICVDYITEHYQKILKDMNTGIIFSPTYTPSIERFEDFSKNFTSYNTATLMSNACCMRNLAAKKNDDNNLEEISVSFVEIPGLKRETFIKCKECSDSCIKNYTAACYFIINLPYKDVNSNNSYCNIKKKMIKYG
ncbi:hypothetical protein KPL47_22810 [Clostridium estertheticum]|uniref:hypothetical protein n=1 Tax=Clostridium TaxID=1485 RepID=UPI001C0BEB0A|nr:MULTISPECIES: hypothetical protein [Clostridium]MBU3146526.1 hypothetical protein [Clostridium sp. CF012]MBU3179129.1 hypothetical protein [Clostridium estertheticum]